MPQGKVHHSFHFIADQVCEEIGLLDADLLLVFLLDSVGPSGQLALCDVHFF